MVDDTYQQSKSYGLFAVIAQMLNLAILLSANLGVMNLLPLPALDGGRLVFLVIEAIRGKRIPPEKEGYVHLVGIVLLMFLMVFVLIFGMILVMIVRGIGEWGKNNRSPRLDVSATVVSKRTHTMRNQNHTSSSSYYVTFQVESGDLSLIHI